VLSLLVVFFVMQDIRKRINSIPPLGKLAQFVAIPTTSGTGSEVTPFAVVTDQATGIKYPLADYALVSSCCRRSQSNELCLQAVFPVRRHPSACQSPSILCTHANCCSTRVLSGVSARA
jgi:hypothetical protein